MIDRVQGRAMLQRVVETGISGEMWRRLVIQVTEGRLVGFDCTSNRKD